MDTNVVAYLLLGTERFVDEVRRFWGVVREPIAPTHWEAELANVVWMAIRSGIVPATAGPRKLDLAARLGVHSVPSRSLWHGAVSRALESGVAVYDTLFVELAAREQLPLATFDAKVLVAFPEIAKRPGALVSE
ncbi:MAG: type II toxin-antitoxin system VapC family toxin [Acidobacteria bacterium]|nr:type II toxin-antitoxin system VapC family toxin [Acidobacteriota bacterium]